MNQDLEHLRLLSIFHYVVAGLTALFGSIFLFHVGMGIAMLRSPETFADPSGPPPGFFPWLFIAMGSAVVLGSWALAAAQVAAGRFLRRHRRHTFCVVVAGIECLLMPFGTVLGVFTIVVLMRDSVKALFGADAASPAGGH